jgi:hypothetical protein
MKKTILYAALALSILSSPARAAALSPEEQSYVVIALNTMSVSHLCGYSVVKGSLGKLGDQTGVDNRIGVAVFEAMKVTMGQDYNSSLLIPEVTRFVNNTVDAMVEITSNKEKYCKQFAPILLERGTIEKKAVEQ